MSIKAVFDWKKVEAIELEQLPTGRYAVHVCLDSGNYSTYEFDSMESADAEYQKQVEYFTANRK